MPKKEIGKLLELLNEYENTLNPNQQIEWTELGVYSTPDLIHSKRFGFIQRLVEQDKIDIKKLVVKGEMRSGWDFENKKGDEEEGEEIWNKYYSELCLMLLSISDTPIEDLISYLK